MRGAGTGPSVSMTTHYWHPHTGGIETVAAAHAAELVSRDWVVMAHSSRVAGSARGDGLATPFESNGAFSITRHRMANPLERWANVPVPLPMPGLRRRLEVDVARSDVVVAHGHVYPITVAAARASRRQGRPFVVVQHSPWVEYPRPVELVEHAADRAIGRRVLEFADLVVCVSRYTEAYVRRIAPHSRTTVISNGVDTERFHRNHLRSGDADAVGPDDGARLDTIDTARAPIRFVTVRRLVPRTGVDVLVEAWRRADLSARAELVVVGAGPARADLERAAAGLTGISFLGRVPDDEVVRLMREADATVVPTRSGEGFGLVAAESHACGTPVIATDQGALGEVVRHEVDGLLVPPVDADALASALIRFATDRDLRERLAAGTRTTDWSWRRVGAELDEALRDVIARHTR